MDKNSGTRIWVNRIVAFLLGSALALMIGYFGFIEPLKSRNNQLTTQIDEIKNGSARLLSEAKSFAKDKNYGQALNSLTTLFAEQPTSAEAVEGRKLAAEIEATVERGDMKWEAAVMNVKTAWEKTEAAQLRKEFEEGMPGTLSRQWEGAKDAVRKEWESGQL
jgi:hypothetical protein